MTGYQSKKKAAQAKLDSMEREALKLALEALEELNNTSSYWWPPIYWWHEVDEATVAKIDSAITAIKETLAQPEQEPVAWMKASDTEWSMSFFEEDGYVPLYTTPTPQRTWVDLTDAEIDAEANSILTSDPVQWWRRLARAVLAKSKEKNNG